MISGQVLLGEALYMWGQGAEGDTLVLEDTGLVLNSLTLFRLVPGAAVGGGEILVDDASGEILIDDTGAVLYDG